MRVHDILNDEGYVNLEHVLKLPEFKALENTPQSSVWHGEGNCLNHTLMVYDEMVKLLKNGAPFRNGATEEAFSKYRIDEVALLVAALCHDLGKATTTKWDDGLKEYKTKNHGLEGERITRKLFFDEPDINLRERICWLVRQHMALHHVFDIDSKVYERMMRLYFDRGNILELCYLNYADSMGSINDESRDGDGFVNDRIERVLMSDFSASLTRYDLERHYYGAIKGSTPTSTKVYVMLGIAGSGKSTWIQNNHPDLPVISRDIIREELGYIKHGEKAKLGKKEESKVSEAFMEKAIKCLENGQDIVIDNLNLTKRYRDAYHKEFLRFAPWYEYVYVEAPTIEDNVARRNGQIPKAEIYRMLDNMEFPEPHEYNTLTLVKQSEE